MALLHNCQIEALGIEKSHFVVADDDAAAAPAPPVLGSWLNDSVRFLKRKKKKQMGLGNPVYKISWSGAWVEGPGTRIQEYQRDLVQYTFESRLL